MKIKDKGKFVEITGVKPMTIYRDLKRKYKSSKILNLFEQGWTFFGVGSITIHKFFLPEMVYLCSILPPRRMYKELVNIILTQSWMSTTTRNFSNRVNISKISSDMIYSLKSYQKNFLSMYDDKKQKYQLKGYILAFEQGLGKTFTSLSLMHGLGKDAIIIIAPKSTIRTVWQNEINNIFKRTQDIWVVGDKLKSARFYIVNYESIDKLSLCLPYLTRAKNIGIIVDECHNFRHAKTQRVLKLQVISKITKCRDILLMSGTPIKALGTEMIPTLELIDPYFDDIARSVFIRTFGMNIQMALDILKNRLGLMMHRQTKEEVLNLLKKTHEEIRIKIPNGREYELDVVKKKIFNFIEERKVYYKSTKKEHERDYENCILFLSNMVGLKRDPNFKRYLNVIGQLKKHGYNRFDKILVSEVSWANNYERSTLRPLLPSDLRKKFDRSKSVVKYMDMKIMGEVIGGLLNRLRSEMFSNMLINSSICEIIKNSEKKTVCFTTYTDVVRATNEYLRRKCGLKPALVFGETTGAIKKTLNDFKENPVINPIIATIQTLSTGVTLVEANTVIFLNQPWRYTDSAQAEDRVHRIGQDTDVFIYTFILDTGSNPNLSTRMNDIVKWSRDMFESIVGK